MIKQYTFLHCSRAHICIRNKHAPLLLSPVSCNRSLCGTHPQTHIMAALIVSTLVIAGVANANPFWRPKLATTLEPNVYTATAASDVYAAQATAPTTSFPKHYKRGKAFDRFLTIWLENTDFSKAAADPNLAWLATKGITLENYHGVTHPSEPNYVAAVGE